jgi:hypothetical protein
LRRKKHLRHQHKTQEEELINIYRQSPNESIIWKSTISPNVSQISTKQIKKQRNALTLSLQNHKHAHAKTTIGFKTTEHKESEKEDKHLLTFNANPNNENHETAFSHTPAQCNDKIPNNHEITHNQKYQTPNTQNSNTNHYDCELHTNDYNRNNETKEHANNDRICREDRVRGKSEKKKVGWHSGMEGEREDNKSELTDENEEQDKVNRLSRRVNRTNKLNQTNLSNKQKTNTGKRKKGGQRTQSTHHHTASNWSNPGKINVHITTRSNPLAKSLTKAKKQNISNQTYRGDKYDKSKTNAINQINTRYATMESVIRNSPPRKTQVSQNQTNNKRTNNAFSMSHYTPSSNTNKYNSRNQFHSPGKFIS